MKLVKVGKYWVNPEKVNFVVDSFAGDSVVIDYGSDSEDGYILIRDLTVDEIVEILVNA